MATANTISEDNFVLELNRVKENVVSKFREISKHLDEKKNQLLKEIDTILVSYQSYKQELETVREKKKALEKTKLYHENELSTGRDRETLGMNEFSFLSPFFTECVYEFSSVRIRGDTMSIKVSE